MPEPGLNLDLLDVTDAEVVPGPVAEAPAVTAPAVPVAEAPPEPVIETAERARDPETGKFVARAPEPVAEPAPAVQPVKEEPRVVPLAAHLEERNRWKQEIADRDRRLAEIQADIQQRIAKIEKPPAPEPDFIEDPKAYVDAKATSVTKELESLKAQAAQLQNEQQFTHFVQEISNNEAAFVEQNPDYYDALDHARTIRSQQLLELYPEATKDQIKQTIRNEELQAAAQLMQRGRNPAEAAFKIAKTLGYQTKAKEPVAAVPRPVVPKAPVADPSSTLGSSGGAPSDEEGITDIGEDDLAPLHEAIRERFGARK